LISKTKCTALNDDEKEYVLSVLIFINSSAENVLGYPAKMSSNFSNQMTLFENIHDKVETYTHTNSVSIPDIPDLDFWFPQHVTRELSFIKKIINQCPNANARDFLNTGFSAIIVSVSYQDSDTRYTRREKGIMHGETIQRWTQKVQDMLQRISELDKHSPLGEVRTITCDVREGIDLPEKIDLVVSSPPYPNAYSYHLYHRYRMLWLEMDQVAFKDQEIGSHRKYSKKVNGANIETFILEMNKVFNSIAEVANKSSYFVMLIGDSIIKGERVDNKDTVLSAIEGTPYNYINSYERDIYTNRKSFNPKIGKIKSEHIIILQRR